MDNVNNNEVLDQAIDSKFFDDNRRIEGFILFVSDDASLDSMFEALGIGC